MDFNLNITKKLQIVTNIWDTLNFYKKIFKIYQDIWYLRKKIIFKLSYGSENWMTCFFFQKYHIYIYIY